MWKSERKEKTLNVKLFVRILPSTDFNYDSIKTETNKKVLYVRCLQDLNKGAHIKNPNYWYFCTDGVFWNSCQSDVYETVTEGLYEDLFDGVRAMIVCYGQTGTGKTFTSSGLRFSFQNRGLILRILSQLFEEVEARRDMNKISIGMSYLEFRGQIIKDLISNKSLDSVRDVVEYSVPGEAWAWEQIFNAEIRKSFAESAPYKGSNRGHTVLTFYVHSESLVDTDAVIRRSKIHIVDMGGIDNYGNKVFRDKLDVGNSNLSKSLMEQLVLCLTGDAFKNENHICPYKSSRFLVYLHDTLQQSCLLRFIAHINGSFENLGLTISTLKFGEKVRSMKPTKLERLCETNQELYYKNLEREYFRLKDEVELIGMLRDCPDFCNNSQERLQEIRRAAEAYLFDQLEELTLFSLGQANLTLKVFKELYQRLTAEKDQILKDAMVAASEMMQSQVTLEKNSNANANVSGSNQKFSRRRSRQMESQISFGTASNTSQNLGRSPSVVQQAGVADRKGISIGPGKMATTFEGNVTKAFKKLKSKKSDCLIIKGMKSAVSKEIGILSTKSQIMDEASEVSISQGVSSRESAWQTFFNENIVLANELSNNAEIAEEKAKEAKRIYMKCLSELAKIREEIEDSKSELEQCQHIRQLYGKGEYEEEGNYGAGDFERNLKETILQKEGLVNEAVENCHVALIDFRNAAEEYSEARRILEEVFQDFCKDRFKLTFMIGDLSLADLRSEESKKELEGNDIKNQVRMELYSQLQEKFLNYIQNYGLLLEQLQNSSLELDVIIVSSA